MKYLSKCILILFIISCSANINSNNLKVATFDTSIHCENCVNTMFDNLPKENGVVDLKVELNEKTVTVIFNTEETTVEKLAEKINELGYSAYIKNLEDFKKN
ncbi:MAG: heavy-metal-associated domain-containing protein [Ignavibacteriae bacterium]|nr:heavy-metal-associated domain-containing protein [Ignavibacteriota bacterium]